MKRPRIVLISMVLSAGFMFASCGKTEDVVDTTAEAETTEITETTESEPEETQVTETEIEETESPLPWAEQNGLTFACDELEMPIWHVLLLDGSVIEEVGYLEGTGSYSVPSVSVSDSEQDGFVEYTIDYSVADPMDAVIPYSVTDHTDNYATWLAMYGMLDYYTGTVIVSGSGGEYQLDDWYTVDVEYEGTDYEISLMGSVSFEGVRNNSSNIDSDNWEWDCERIINYQLVIRVPEDYDGLVLFIDTAGAEEPDSYDPDNDICELHVFGSEEGETIEDHQFARVTDLLVIEE